MKRSLIAKLKAEKGVWQNRKAEKRGELQQGLSLHYYTRAGAGKDSATEFDESAWFSTLKKTLFMDELIRQHSAVMDTYDPSKRVALIVDEWGTWHAVEPGTNPHFLYQQNTMRDALVAGINLNIFNKHCRRVKMANIAQTVNVLQAMILTQSEKMLLTPTYHVFEMYKVHQNASLLKTCFRKSEKYKYKGDEIPQVSVSASKDSSGRVNISLCNLHASEKAQIRCEMRGMETLKASGRILTAEQISAHNTFEDPDNVKTSDFSGISLDKQGLVLELPSASVALITVQG